jgi:hypothetical protein
VARRDLPARAVTPARLLAPLAARVDEAHHSATLGWDGRCWRCDVYDWALGVPLRALLRERRSEHR